MGYKIETHLHTPVISPCGVLTPRELVDGYLQADLAAVLQDPVIRSMTRPQVEKAVEQAKKNMQKAAADLNFMAAAKYRDEMWALQQYLKVWRE